MVGTPNHPEYPAAHGSITSAMAEVFSTFLGVNQFNLVVHGFNPACRRSAGTKGRKI